VKSQNIDPVHAGIYGRAVEPIYASHTMIYKFKSKVTGDLIMLQTNGEALLRIIGKDKTGSLRQGILLPHEMPQAVAVLQQAVASEETARTEQVKFALANGDAAPKSPALGLRQRSLPFIQMLQRCMAENEEVVWGV
jgi:Domain of unknown function (DUF1840)